MGLFVDDNGHYRGWLAGLLCCFAAVNEDEYPAERNKHNAQNTSKEIPYQQQHALASLPTLPIANRVSSKSNIGSDTNSLHDSRHSDSFNPSKPLNFDPDSLLPRPVTTDLNQDEHVLTPSTTNDTVRTHRHVRPSPIGSIRRQALVPLQLGPVVLRDAAGTAQDSTLSVANQDDTKPNHVHQRNESTQNLLSNAAYQSYFEECQTSYQRCSRQDFENLAHQVSSQESTTRFHTTPAFGDLKTTTSTPSLSSSYKRHARDISTSSSLQTLTERPRTSGARLQRKRSNQSKSSIGGGGDSDVEKEVLELNTIVEERRAENNKSHLHTLHHIPAVAPTMQIGARSQTLNDIGSALSRPLTTTTTTLTTTFRASSPPRSTQGTRNDSKSGEPRSSHISGWLSSVAPLNASSNPTADTVDKPEEPFYQSHAHNHGGGDAGVYSTNSSNTALESVLTFTLDSSPTTSKRYSRSLMVTPLTPLDGDEEDKTMSGRVGIAL